MNTLVAAGPANRTLTPNQTYRFAGLVRGSSDSAADITNAMVQAALNQAGITNLVYYPPSSALPADWPDDSSLPSPSSDERYFRAQGVYALSGPLPNAIAVGSGVATIYLVWSYVSDVAGVVYSTPPSASAATAARRDSAEKFIATMAIIVGLGLIGWVAVEKS